jgi:histidinol-phosphate aminotransferase
VQLALQALRPESLALTQARVQLIRTQRQIVFDALGECAQIKQVYPSQGNYLLVRCIDAEATLGRLLEAGY